MSERKPIPDDLKIIYAASQALSKRQFMSVHPWSLAAIIERIADLEALLAAKQDALSEARREIAERQRLLDEAIGQIERLKISNQTLLTALDRTAQALGYAFSKKPLRDMAETLAEARAAIAQATKEA